MGFFSFLTQDTDRSIANRHSTRKTFTVYMKDDKGNVYREDNYNGYGCFDGKDFYDLLVEMNWDEFQGTPADKILIKERILEARDLYFRKIHPMTEEEQEEFEEGLKWPSLSEDPNYEWTGMEPPRCIDQGFFYSDPDPEFDAAAPIKINALSDTVIECHQDGKLLGTIEIYRDPLPRFDLGPNHWWFKGEHWWFKAEYDYRYTPEFHSNTALQVLTKLQAHFGVIQ